MSRAPGRKPSAAHAAERRAEINLRRKIDFLAAALGEKLAAATHLIDPATPVPALDLLNACPRSIAALHAWKFDDLPIALQLCTANFVANGPKTLKKYPSLKVLAQTYVDQVDEKFKVGKPARGKLESMASLKRQKDEALKLQRIAMTTLHALRMDAQHQISEARSQARASQADLQQALIEIERLRAALQNSPRQVSTATPLRREPKP